MSDLYTHVVSPTTFGSKLVAVTPDASDLPGGIAKAVVMLEDGDITVVPATNADDESFTFTGCPVGFTPPCRVRRVLSSTAAVAAIYE